MKNLDKYTSTNIDKIKDSCNMDYMNFHLYFEVVNAIISFVILLMLLYILWFMTTKKDIVRSIMFLKGDKLKIPTIFIAIGILLFVIRESYKAIHLFGINTIELMEELLEFGTIILIFIGIFMVFSLFLKRKVKGLSK